MKLAQRHLRLGALAALFASVSIACIDASGQADQGGTEPPDSGTPPLPLDGGAPPDDADGDGGSNPDATKPKRTCTSEGWCHTVVPGKQTLRSVWGDGQGTVWAVSAEGNVLRWDGSAWVQSYAAGVPLETIWGSGPTDLWVGGGTPGSESESPTGTLLHGTGMSSGTITWTAVPVPLTIRSIWGSGPSDVWAVASRGDRVSADDASFVLHYAGPPSGPDGGGAAWESDPVSNAFPAHFERVWGTGPNDVWVSGRVELNSWSSRGQVLHRRPDGQGGHEWLQEQPATEETTARDVFGFSVSPAECLLIGFTSDFVGDGFLHRGLSSDQGASFAWTEHSPHETGFSDGALSTLWGTSASDIWVAGQRGRLRHWDGVAWRVAVVSVDDDFPEQRAINAIWGSSPDHVWAVGADIAVHKSPKQ